MDTNNRSQPQPMPGLSKRAQQLLRPVPNQIVLTQRGYVIPNSFRTTKGGSNATGV